MPNSNTAAMDASKSACLNVQPAKPTKSGKPERHHLIIQALAIAANDRETLAKCWHAETPQHAEALQLARQFDELRRELQKEGRKP